MNNNYFFVDGASLLADIRAERAELRLIPGSKFNLLGMVDHFIGSKYSHLHAGAYRRFVFYFVQDNERLRSTVLFPDFTRPDVGVDVRVEICGKRLPEVERARAWLEEQSAPDFVMQSVYRSEKAVDTQICCDALQLAATGKLDKLFLYTNDYDFAPLCRALRNLGANVDLIRMRSAQVNEKLVRECDGFHTMDGVRADVLFQAPASTASVDSGGHG